MVCLQSAISPMRAVRTFSALKHDVYLQRLVTFSWQHGRHFLVQSQYFHSGTHIISRLKLARKVAKFKMIRDIISDVLQLNAKVDIRVPDKLLFKKKEKKEDFHCIITLFMICVLRVS